MTLRVRSPLLVLAAVLGLAAPAAAQMPSPAQAQARPYFDEANAAIHRDDFAAAVAPMTRAAELGYAPAQIALGEMINNGWGFEPNVREAVRWWRRAAEQGDRVGQVYLGYVYRSGSDSIPQDHAEALRWFRRSAEQGMPPAMLHVAIMYEAGEGVRADREEAIRWYRRTAESGDESSAPKAIDALTRLGSLHASPQTEAWSGPFGLAMGMSRGQVIEAAGGMGPGRILDAGYDEQGRPNVYLAYRVSRPEAPFDQYMISFAPTTGLCSVMAAWFGPSREEAVAAFDRVQQRLARRHGPARESSDLKRLWNDPVGLGQGVVSANLFAAPRREGGWLLGLSYEFENRTGCP